MNRFGPKDSSPDSYPELDSPSPKATGLDSFFSRFEYGRSMTESFWFYNRTVELRFNTEEHVYYLVESLGNLTEQNGVTNTCHIINASEMLVPWAAKVTIAKLLRLVPTETDATGALRIKPITFEEFTTVALEAKSAHKDKLDEAGDIGHMAHKCLEDSIRHAIANDPEKIVRQLIGIPQDERAVNAATGAKSWMDKHRVRWVETETKIYSKLHRYAGTMDGLAYVNSCDDKSCCREHFVDRLSLIDWKSSNYLKIEYLFQTASYQAAKLEEFPELNIVDRWILRLGKSEEEAGKFEPWHMEPSDFEQDFKGFLACLALTRAVDEVNTRMKEQKKLIRKVRKEIKEAAKLIQKEKEKLEKALKKAEEKKKKDEEKERVKAEAKANREAAKAAKKAGVVANTKLTEDACTLSESMQLTTTEKSQLLVTKLDTSIPQVSGIQRTHLIEQSITTHMVVPENSSIFSTEETERETPRERRENGPRLSDIVRVVDSHPEESYQVKPISLPEEK